MKIFVPYSLAGLLLLTTCLNSVQAKEKAKIGLSYLKTGAEQRQLTVEVKSRMDNRYQPVEGLTLGLYLENDSESELLGNVVTDAKGKGILMIPSSFISKMNEMSEFNFVARLEDNDGYTAKEKDLLIREAFLDVDYIIRDSLKLIQASVKEKDSLGNTVLPTVDVEIKFLVERPFSRLPIGGKYNMLNKEGKATIEFPDDLPGDSMGHISVVVKIEDSDVYGNIEKTGDVIWGVPTVFDDATIKRTLWSAGANAPYPLLVLVNSLIAAVWGIMLFILIRIFHIKKADN
ncbi:MAG TPA: hypothetical protein DCX54_03915 [Flavobacteriales bacterium]|nr:hypothetical protein [Flavobacteriales bacterium]